MNIVEAFKIARETKKGIRPIWAVKNVQIKYWNFGRFALCDINGVFMRYFSINLTTMDDFNRFVLSEWEVVNEKPNKQTQYKIDSMKFQIVRHCKNNVVNGNASCKECIITKTCDKTYKKNNETPYTNALDDWSLKEIVEAYHILKETGEI